MTALAIQFAEALAETERAVLAEVIPWLPPVTARAAEPDDRLLAIVTKAGPLTAEEQRYLDARERLS